MHGGMGVSRPEGKGKQRKREGKGDWQVRAEGRGQRAHSGCTRHRSKLT